MWEKTEYRYTISNAWSGNGKRNPGISAWPDGLYRGFPTSRWTNRNLGWSRSTYCRHHWTARSFTSTPQYSRTSPTSLRIPMAKRPTPHPTSRTRELDERPRLVTNRLASSRAVFKKRSSSEKEGPPRRSSRGGRTVPPRKTRSRRRRLRIRDVSRPSPRDASPRTGSITHSGETPRPRLAPSRFG